MAGAVRQHLLVVDDDAELCQLLLQYLTPEGYRVEAVHSGLEGVERALSGDHALVVLDVMLPDVRGFEVLRRVRAHRGHPAPFAARSSGPRTENRRPGRRR